MRESLHRQQWLIGACIFFVAMFMAVELEARGRGGGSAGFSRSGPAAGGSFKGRSSFDRSSRSFDRSSKKNSVSDRRDNRKDVKSERRDNRKDVRSERREFRHDVRSERREWHEDRYRRRAVRRVAVGTTLTVASWNSLTCHRTVYIREGISYYSCDGYWYRPYYRGNSVVYVVVDTPAGY